MIRAFLTAFVETRSLQMGILNRVLYHLLVVFFVLKFELTEEIVKGFTGFILVNALSLVVVIGGFCIFASRFLELWAESKKGIVAKV